jgi:hypothetical protein
MIRMMRDYVLLKPVETVEETTNDSGIVRPNIFHSSACEVDACGPDSGLYTGAQVIVKANTAVATWDGKSVHHASDLLCAFRVLESDSESV